MKKIFITLVSTFLFTTAQAANLKEIYVPKQVLKAQKLTSYLGRDIGDHGEIANIYCFKFSGFKKDADIISKLIKKNDSAHLLKEFYCDYNELARLSCGEFVYRKTKVKSKKNILNELLQVAGAEDRFDNAVNLVVRYTKSFLKGRKVRAYMVGMTPWPSVDGAVVVIINHDKKQILVIETNYGA